MGDRVLIEFNNNTAEVIHLYNTHKPIVDVLTKKDNPICNIIGTDDKVEDFDKDTIIKVKTKKPLGQGGSGVVYSIKIGNKSNDYVVKLAYEIDANNMIKPCYSDIQRSYKPTAKLPSHYKFPFSKEIREPNYTCNETYSEYLISLLMSRLYKNGNVSGKPTGPFCINFIDVLDFVTCYKPLTQYTFMERMDGVLYDAINESKLDEIDIKSIIIQILFAICMYQHHYKISHNDLHAENIFVKNIDNGDIIYNGKSLKDVKYFAYKLPNDKYIFFPRGKYLIKIGDWGYSCKFSDTKILNEDVMTGKTSIKRPNWYEPLYDLLYVIDILIETEDTFAYVIRNIITSGKMIPYHKENRRPILSSLVKAPVSKFKTAERVIKMMGNDLSFNRCNNKEGVALIGSL